jgi:hypothetical protein
MVRISLTPVISGWLGDRGECRGAHGRIGGFTDQQFLGVPAEDDCDVAEQGGDHQRGRTFPRLDSGQLVQCRAGRRRQHADHRHRVFACDGLDRGVRAAQDEDEDAAVGVAGLVPHLGHGFTQRRAFQDQ